MPFSLRKPKTYSLNDTLPFGKHQGEKLQDVIDNDPEYVDWMVKNIATFDIGADAIDYLDDSLNLFEDIIDY